MKKGIYIFTIIFSIISIYVFPNGVNANVNPEFNIDTNQHDQSLFNLSNIKPGDWSTRILTVQNRGEKFFTYNTKVKFLNGSEKLYNEFQLRIWDSKGLLFDDKLHKFNGLNPRFLQAGNQEDIKFEVKFPYELGNEFQNLGFNFELRFMIEERDLDPDPDNPSDPSDPGKPDPSDPANDGEEPILPQRPIPAEELDNLPLEGQILPSTATSTYNNLLLGILLVISGGGLFIHQKRKRKVKQD